MTTRNGKIAHLPRPLRDDLSQRIDNGTPGHKLLAWLNTHPEVKSVLAEYYPGTHITQQNLSEWRQGGYQDWVKLQTTERLTLELAQDPGALEPDDSAKKLANAFATITTVEFIHAAQNRLRECTGTEERWKHVCEMNTQMSRLRREDHRAANASLRKEQWDYRAATEERTAIAAAREKERHDLLTRLKQELPALASTVSIPAGTKPTGCADLYATPLMTVENQAENLQFPSGTHRNQSQNNCTAHPSTQPSATFIPHYPVNNSCRPQPAILAVNQSRLTCDADLSTIASAKEETSATAENRVENPQFPSGTHLNQTHKKISATAAHPPI